MRVKLILLIVLITTLSLIKAEDGSFITQSNFNQKFPDLVGKEFQVKKDLFDGVDTDYVLYASWNDSDNRNQGYIYIYTLYDNTNITVYYCTSFSGCQMNSVLTSWSSVSADRPLSYGPLTGNYYFFKIVSNYPITCELATYDYSSYRDANRMVLSTNLNYTGTTFYYHAHNANYEQTWIINPNSNIVDTIQVYYWSNNTWNLYNTYTNLGGDSYLTFHCNYATFYKVVSTSNILVWEGRLFNQNMGIGASPEGTTVSNIIYCPAPYDSYGNGEKLCIAGITDASYTVYYKQGSNSWAVQTTGTVSANSINVLQGLPENRLYKIVTSNANEKIQVQMLASTVGRTWDGGSEMIPGHDNNVSTNPGTTFIFRYGHSYQRSIACLIPTPGTTVNISGPTSSSYTSTNPDEGFRINISSNQGTYIITATNPIYVVAETNLGDQAAYFVYRTEPWLTPTPTVSPTPTLTPTPPPVPTLGITSILILILTITSFMLISYRKSGF